MEVSKAWREKIIEGEQISSELSSADSCSQAKCHLVQPIYNKRTKDFVVCHIINILLIDILYGRILTLVVCTDRMQTSLRSVCTHH